MRVIDAAFLDMPWFRESALKSDPSSNRRILL